VNQQNIVGGKLVVAWRTDVQIAQDELATVA